MTTTKKASLTTLLSSVSSIYEYSKGVSSQDKAVKTAGVGYRQAGQQAKDVAEYNIAIDEYDLANTLDDIARQAVQVIGVQRNQQADNNFDISSASNVSVVNAGLDIAMRSAIRARAAQKISAQGQRYQAALAAVDGENRARLAEYQAQTVAAKGKADRFKFLSPLINQFGGLFSND